MLPIDTGEHAVDGLQPVPAVTGAEPRQKADASKIAPSLIECEAPRCPNNQLPTDPASFLEERRREVRRRYGVRPLSPEERRASEDVHWALQDPDVQSSYPGEFVVPYGHTIVAHGHNAVEVLEEAARNTGVRIENLPLVGIVNPLLDIPH